MEMRSGKSFGRLRSMLRARRHSGASRVRRILHDSGLVAEPEVLATTEDAEIFDDRVLMKLRAEIGQVEPSASALIVRERDLRT
jgi:hypothetical protein